MMLHVSGIVYRVQVSFNYNRTQFVCACVHACVDRETFETVYYCMPCYSEEQWSSYLNHVELQNSCLALAHANLFIPSTLGGTCMDSNTGKINKVYVCMWILSTSIILMETIEQKTHQWNLSSGCQKATRSAWSKFRKLGKTWEPIKKTKIITPMEDGKVAQEALNR